jgi:hypothetical protein
MADGSAHGGGPCHALEGGAEKGDLGGVADLQGPDAVDQELAATLLHTSLTPDGSCDLSIAILRWLRLLVSPITAVETMSLSCIHVRHGCSIRIQLVNLAPVKRAEFQWKPVLEYALRLHPELKDVIPAVIAVIEE